MGHPGWAKDPAWDKIGHMRGAWWRSQFRGVLSRIGFELCELLALSGAHCPVSGGTSRRRGFGKRSIAATGQISWKRCRVSIEGRVEKQNEAERERDVGIQGVYKIQAARGFYEIHEEKAGRQENREHSTRFLEE